MGIELQPLPDNRDIVRWAKPWAGPLESREVPWGYVRRWPVPNLVTRSTPIKLTDPSSRQWRPNDSRARARVAEVEDNREPVLTVESLIGMLARPRTGEGHTGAVVLLQPRLCQGRVIADDGSRSQCGADLAGKRSRARYCDECEGSRRKVDSTRRLRARKSRDKLLSATTAVLVDYVERVRASERDRTILGIPWQEVDAVEVERDLVSVPERRQAAILDVLSGRLDSRDKDVLARRPVGFIEDRYSEDESSLHNTDDDPMPVADPAAYVARAQDVAWTARKYGLEVPACDGKCGYFCEWCADLRWCVRNHGAGVLSPTLGHVAIGRAKSGRQGQPRLRWAPDLWALRKAKTPPEQGPISRKQAWSVCWPRVLPEPLPVGDYRGPAAGYVGGVWVRGVFERGTGITIP